MKTSQIKTLAALAFGLSSLIASVVLSLSHDDVQSTAFLGLTTSAFTYLFGLHDNGDSSE